MTLMEIVIAVALVALAAGIAVPSLAHLTRRDLRRSATLLAQKVRETYTLAALGGRTWRMVLAVGGHSVEVEETGDILRLYQGHDVSVQSDVARLLARSQMGSQLDANAMAARQALLGLPFEVAPEDPNDLDPHAAPKGADFSRTQVAPLAFAGSVHILDVWTDGMEAPVTEGVAYLYLFPQGFTQNALIHLEDADKRVFAVRIRGLTGRADIEAGYQEHGP